MCLHNKVKIDYKSIENFIMLGASSMKPDKNPLDSLIELRR